MAKQIVKAKEYKVQDGDSLKTIADANGITWQELAKFNYGTDEPTEVNKGMREKTGAFKKAKDGVNLSFSSLDDPGILYIPETFPEPTFATNSAKTITLKAIPQKTFIASKVMVEFRPKSDWKGEFGFDWLRIGGFGETSYKSLISSGYNGTEVKADGTVGAKSFTKDEAWTNLKLQFKKLETKVTEQPKYRVPILNLYPPDVKGTPTPPSSAELKILTIVEEEEPLKIEFEYHKGLISIDKPELQDKAIGKKRESSDQTIKISILNEFDRDQEIKVLAYPKTWKLGDAIPIAGKIIVSANSSYYRKRFKCVLIPVKTKIIATDAVGAYRSSEVNTMKRSFYQALIYCSVEKAPTLDLSEDKDYKIVTKADGTKEYGAFIYKRTSAADTKNDGGVNTSAATSVFEDLKKKFLDETVYPDNVKYKDYFKVFVFDTAAQSTTLRGEAQGIPAKSAILFKPSSPRPSATMGHEVSHGLGLAHTHEDPIFDMCKFTFDYKTTNNLMSYSTNRFYLWNWQWKILRKNI